MQPLQFAYAVNVAVLAPIAVPTVFRLFPTDQGRFAESQGWRVLVGALWLAILVLSILGLFHPLRYSAVLLLQLIYKSVWLGVYVVPRLYRRELAAVPWGITSCFALIVIVWPFLIPWACLLGWD
jgi:hypothetical protein